MISFFNPLTSSFSCGTFRQVRLRMTYLLLCLMVITLFVSSSLALGSLICLIWFLSLMWHEYAQITVARLNQKDQKRVRQVVLWPTGGLELYLAGYKRKERIWSILAGPLAYLAVCLIVAPFVWNHTAFPSAFRFSALPVSNPDTINGAELLLLILFINWNLFVVNLLPIVPLDGGRFVEEFLRGSYELTMINQVMRATAIFGGFLLMAGGLMIGHTWLMLLGMLLLCFALYQKISDLLVASEVEENESFLGYDFSAGYTSLEKPEEVPPAPRLSWWERRRQKKQRKLKQKKLLAEIQAREQLDLLLDKVHKSGMASLTAVEQRTLKMASKQIRTQHQNG